MLGCEEKLLIPNIRRSAATNESVRKALHTTPIKAPRRDTIPNCSAKDIRSRIAVKLEVPYPFRLSEKTTGCTPVLSTLEIPSISSFSISISEMPDTQAVIVPNPSRPISSFTCCPEFLQTVITETRDMDTTNIRIKIPVKLPLFRLLSASHQTRTAA